MRDRLLAASVLVLVATAGGAADWPQYRGPQRLGVAAQADLLDGWPKDGPRVAWRRSIGGGYSSVAAVGDRLFTLDTDGAEEAVLALDAATGDTLWRVPIGPFVQAELEDGGPRSTPAVAGGTVYAVSSQARLVALAAADGALRWQHDLTAWGPVPRFGYATSPLVEGRLVVVLAGQRGEEPGVVAFDRETGELAWQALSGPAGYTSVVAVELAGVRQLVLSLFEAVVGLSLEGELLWRYDTEPHAAIPMPVVVPPDGVFVSSSEDAFGGVLLRVARHDDGFRVTEAWKQRLMRNHFNSSLAVDGALYGFDNGTLRCLDATTGERLWAKRGFGKGSLVAAGKLLFVLGDDGTVALVHADRQGYREAGRIQAMRGRAWTEPALAGGHLYLRDFDELVSLDLRRPAAPAEVATP